MTPAAAQTLDDMKLEPAPSAAEMRAYADKHNILILAHSYQEGEIQDAAHVVADSLELARAAYERKARDILFCGVHFMAETAKILCPTARVFVPDLEAGCSLADGCDARDLEQYQKFLRNKLGVDIATVCYINCTAAVKALCDVVCTSGNALDVIACIPENRPILFVPDMHLGAWLKEQSEREIYLWNSSCIVHELFSIETLNELKKQHPGAITMAHPECPKNIRDASDYVRGTAGMIKLAQASKGKTFIVATEGNMLYKLSREAPGNTYLAAPGPSCACNLCPHMQKNTPEKVWRALRTRKPEVYVPESVASKARVALERMLAIKPSKMVAIPAGLSHG